MEQLAENHYKENARADDGNHIEHDESDQKDDYRDLMLNKVDWIGVYCENDAQYKKTTDDQE